MADIKKFLDQEGVQFLWSKISMQDYPNNDTLMAVIEAIDETKADKTDLVQSDWNESDETSLSYIQNKPFGEDIKNTEKLIVNIENHAGGCILLTNSNQLPAGDYVELPNGQFYCDNEGKNFKILFNNVEYLLTSYYYSEHYGGDDGFFIGDRNLAETPFYIYKEYGNYGSTYLCTNETNINMTVFEISYSLNTIDDKFIPDTVSRVGHSHDYSELINIPLGEIKEYSEILPDTPISIAETGSVDIDIIIADTVQEGNTYLVNYDGVLYECICFKNMASNNEELVIGNGNYCGMYGYANDAPFCIYFYTSYTRIFVAEVGNHTIKIDEVSFSSKQLDEKYIPDTIARISDIPEGFSGSYNDLTDKPNIPSQASDITSNLPADYATGTTVEDALLNIDGAIGSINSIIANLKNTLELITVDDIDNICGASIAAASEVQF